MAELELEQKVVELYNNLLKSHRLFFISGSIVDNFRVQSIRAEKDFANGVINIAEYTRLQQMMNQATMGFELQRSEFISSVMALEGIIGAELNI